MSDPTPTPPAGAPATADRRLVERRAGEQRRVERALWQGALALLCGLVAIALALVVGWRMYAQERELEAVRSAKRLAERDTESVRSSLATLNARAVADAAALARLEAVPGRIESLDGRVARVEARIEAPQRTVARVEAAHLVELAAHRLELERDVSGAIELLEAAAARLADGGDPRALAARAQLARDLIALRAVAGPDVGAIGARLAAAEAAARDLPMLGAIKNQYVPPGATPPPPGLARAWWRLTTSLQDLVSVRRVSDATVRLVSMEEMGVRRQHLETLLFAARLAALRGDDSDYAANLAAARDWLGRYFDRRDTAVSGVDAELATLAASHVSAALPDVSGSLRLLRGKAP